MSRVLELCNASTNFRRPVQILLIALKFYSVRANFVVYVRIICSQVWFWYSKLRTFLPHDATSYAATVKAVPSNFSVDVCIFFFPKNVVTLDPTWKCISPIISCVIKNATCACAVSGSWHWSLFVQFQRNICVKDSFLQSFQTFSDRGSFTVIPGTNTKIRFGVFMQNAHREHSSPSHENNEWTRCLPFTTTQHHYYWYHLIFTSSLFRITNSSQSILPEYPQTTTNPRINVPIHNVGD
jgi:hypothetical protein